MRRMALRPKSLEIEGFRSFVKRVKLLFPETGMVLISGKWQGSDVSSGSGKSTILMAMAFALDICDIPATDLKSWYSKKLFVELVLTDGTNEYVVTRDPKLSLKINGEEYNGLTKGAKEKLREILMTDLELVKDLTYREQRSRGKFINSTDSEKKEFLSQLLKLDKFEALYEKYNKEQSDTAMAVTLLETQIQTMRSMNGSEAPVTAQEIQAAEANVEQCKKRIWEMGQGNLEVLQQQLQFAQSELQKFVTAETQMRIAQNNNASLRTSITQTKQQIETMKAHKCPTCEQEWHNNQTKVEGVENYLADCLKQFESNMVLIKNAQIMVDQLPVMRQEVSKLQIQIGESQAPLRDAQSALASANQLLSNLNMKLRRQEANASDIDQKEKSVQEKKSRLTLLNHYVEILGRNGFMGSIFDELLKEIEHRMNNMIGYLPNVSHLTVSLSSTTVTKTKGTAKKEISTKILNKTSEVSFRGLSGGQQCSLELCADLAYAETVRARSGSPLSWVALDEAMEGFGIEEKRAALDMIRQKVSGTVFIIDHATEIKEGFAQVIEVRYDGKESHVE